MESFCNLNGENMYHLNNTYSEDILSTIRPDHISEYDWLMDNMKYCREPAYQKRYRTYWRMNAARLCPAYCTAYFDQLHVAQSRKIPLSALARTLYATPTTRTGKQSLQISFASKLLHTADPHLPIYDALVRDFYFWTSPSPRQSLNGRINTLYAFYTFLEQEYQRVLTHNLLQNPIRDFRSRFTPKHFTDEKIIDSLLWAFVALLKHNAIPSGLIEYD